MGKVKLPGSGGGAALNFKVVGYATKEELLAATPAENTIGIITEVPITGYHFGTEEPSPAAAGMVWITTGTSSAIEFNALKKNAIQVYPLSAKQHDGSAWVDVTALSYQGGEWVNWIVYLYNKGDECEALTGGWRTVALTAVAGSNDMTSKPTVSKDSASMTITGVADSGALVITTSKIDLTGRKTIVLDAAITISTTDPKQCMLCVWSAIGSVQYENRVASMSFETNVDGEIALDITDIGDGEYYVGFGMHGNSPKMVVMRSLRVE